MQQTQRHHLQTATAGTSLSVPYESVKLHPTVTPHHSPLTTPLIPLTKHTSDNLLMTSFTITQELHFPVKILHNIHDLQVHHKNSEPPGHRLSINVIVYPFYISNSIYLSIVTNSITIYMWWLLYIKARIFCGNSYCITGVPNPNYVGWQKAGGSISSLDPLKPHTISLFIHTLFLS